MNEEDALKAIDTAYESGKIQGWKDASAWLRKQAADLFTRDKDELAHTLKSYSAEMLRTLSSSSPNTSGEPRYSKTCMRGER